METLNEIVLKVQHYLSDYILIVALVVAGLWFTARTGFIQVRGFKRGMKQVFGGLFGKKGEAGNDGMSSFQALATAIAAQVGNWEYCRCSYCDRNWRSGSDLLDVGSSVSWNGKRSMQKH